MAVAGHLARDTRTGKRVERDSLDPLWSECNKTKGGRSDPSKELFQVEDSSLDLPTLIRECNMLHQTPGTDGLAIKPVVNTGEI